MDTTKPTDTHATAAIPITVGLAGVVRVLVPESEATFTGSILVASHGQMTTDNAPQRSERVTQQPAKLLDTVEVYVVATTPLRNMACERKSVTAEMRTINLRPNGKQTLLNWVSVSRALQLLKEFRPGYCPLVGQTFSSCDPVPPALRAKVRIEVHQHIVYLPCLQVGQ